MDEQVKLFAQVNEKTKRSFSARKTQLNAKSIGLMASMAQFEIVDPINGNVISMDDLNAYDYKPDVVYEVRRVTEKQTDEFHPVANINEFQDLPYHRKKISLSGRDLLLFLLPGSPRSPKDLKAEHFSAMDAICYHFGGPLDEADIEDVAGHQCVICPWHRYPIALDTGESFLKTVNGHQSKGVKQRIHTVKLESDGTLAIKLNLDGKIDSDHYACMGIFKFAQQKTPPKNVHSKIGAAKEAPQVEFSTWLLEDLDQISPDTYVMNFRSQVPRKLSIPVGHHLRFRIPNREGGHVTREYTPIAHHANGFQLLVKTYDVGIFSEFFRGIQVGDTLEVENVPMGRFTYNFNEYRALGMIAAGSGITPMFQIIKAALSNRQDRTKIHLVFANRRRDDILLKSQLDGFARENPNRFKVLYLLSQV
eukprot:TRINITY_DN7024_c0_g1_i2.p1 TRINITY_DN7024_c0_g1~~TRINITY_DN7024_c0_g1_i2.p1  ORF type:complete len:421 (-),score=138.00 TRINITY_DN7024_c0_g1_i2:47-1309(-)